MTLPHFTIDCAFGSFPADATYTWTTIHDTNSPYFNTTANTGYVRGVQWSRGLNDLLGRTETGSGTVVLRNQMRDWDPENAASPFYPNIRPGLPFRLRGFIGAAEYPVFQHFANGYPQNRHGPSYSEVAIPTVDGFARLALAAPMPDNASLTIDPAGVNNTLVYTAKNPGIAELDTTIQYIGGPFKPIRVAVKGRAIEIRYHQTGLHGDPDDTATIFKNAVNGNAGAAALVTVTDGGGSSGAGTILTDFGPTNLAGADAAAFPAELSGARINRCLDQAGWPAALRDIDTGTVVVAAAPFSSDEQGRLLSHVLDVAGEPGEFGIVYVDGRGYCVFLDRNSLYSNSGQATYSGTFSDRHGDSATASAGLIKSGYGILGVPGLSGRTYTSTEAVMYVDSEPNTDREHVINEWQGTREGGVAIIVRDDTSIAQGFGRSTHQISSLLATDTHVRAQLEFGRDEYGEPIQVIQSMTVMPGTSQAAWEACLSTDVGDRVRVLSHPPGGGAAIDKVYLVTRVAGQMDIGPVVSARFQYGLTPIRLTNYFVWDDPVFGNLDTTVLAYN